MRTIILCGGTGTRLKEETEFKPKPMVLIGDKPILWHIMKIYSHYGYNDFILALGYKGDYIKEYFLNQKSFTTDFTLNTYTHKTKFYFKNRLETDKFIITFVNTGLDTLIGERILQCKKYVPKKDKCFMVTYGDGVADINIKELIKFHVENNTVATITGIHPVSKYGLVKINNSSLVINFHEKPRLTDWVNGGFMVFKKDFFNYLREGEMEHPALKKLVKIKQLSLYRHQGYFMAIDTYRELEDLNKTWQTKNPPWKVWT